MQTRTKSDNKSVQHCHDVILYCRQWVVWERES